VLRSFCLMLASNPPLLGSYSPSLIPVKAGHVDPYRLGQFFPSAEARQRESVATRCDRDRRLDPRPLYHIRSGLSVVEVRLSVWRNLDSFCGVDATRLVELGLRRALWIEDYSVRSPRAVGLDRYGPSSLIAHIRRVLTTLASRPVQHSYPKPSVQSTKPWFSFLTTNTV
jgi:hypothetical protein